MNKEVIQEIYNQAVERLKDVLETKKSFEQKAFILLTGFITLSTFFLSLSSSLFQKDNMASIPVSAVGIGFFLASVFALLFLKASNFGSLGSNPSMWLKDEYIKGDEEALSCMLLYLSEFYQERIKESVKSNNLRARFINISILIAIFSPLMFILSYFL